MKSTRLNGIEITHIHHSAVKIKTQDLVIYADPYRVTDEQADLILITHDHPDHFDIGSIMKLQKPETKILGPEALMGKVNNLKTMHPGEQFPILGGNISAIPSYNLKKPNHPKEKGYLAYVVYIVGKRIFVPGDTDKTPEMEKLKNIDLAFLPIAGPMMHEDEAASAVKAFKPKIVVPYHYGKVLVSFGMNPGDPQVFAGLVDNAAKVEILE